MISRSLLGITLSNESAIALRRLVFQYLQLERKPSRFPHLPDLPFSSLAQDHSLATDAPKFGPEDRVLDWSNPAALLVNLVRALSPEPAATTSRTSPTTT